MNARLHQLIIVLGLIIIPFATLRGQIDSLIMNTDEVLVGEIKDLKQGVLTIETDYSDSDFKVEWDKVEYINTERKYIITMSNGNRYHGSIKSLVDRSQVMVDDDVKGKVPVKLIDVVYLKSVEDKFINRIDLLMSVGYSLTKENQSQQISARINAGYLSNVIAIEAYFNMVRTVQTPDSTTIRSTRTEGGLGFRFFIIRDWFVMAGTELLQSSEQKLNLRALTKGGAGNYIVNTNRMYFVLAAGAAWNYEDYDDVTIPDRNSAEAFAALEYNIFDIGDLDLKTTLVGYPSLTESGRFRSDFSFDLKYEFPLDFFVNLGFTLNYDNQPVEGASETDYVLQTTFGWEL